ncbi:copper resistance CopC/CopD family protein [Paenibacillus roseipurpureus]|uniref:Copper resistance protein CopC n=1 Tax=Paenibacillus roseopurpureus TaxID=2918901 RepID=A0AA96LM34_9BACL|nr:copper resistance protein CopC [Paenibacillus sp. MBLB1832]WNR43621.1 copper resistance protein CopC [Paenibacillus sp. MBLB1832]
MQLHRGHRNFKWLRGAPMLILAMIAFLLVSTVAAPQSASAHASLVEAIPESGAQLESSPAQVKVTFNEPLDSGLFYIKVYDHSGAEVTRSKAQMNKEQTGLELSLPKLAEGVYLISYHVISADGHPVGGSYPITVGNPPQEDLLDVPSAHTGHNHNAGPLTTKGLLQYASRGLWFLMLLSLTGWVAWLRLVKVRDDQEHKAMAAWSLNLQRAHIVALLLLIFTHIEDLLGGGGVNEVWQLLSSTNIGISWALLLLLSFFGFVLVGRFLWLDVLWAFVLLAVKSFSGHAASFSPLWATISLDFIHLVAAACWVGGLVLLYAKWRINKTGIGMYMKTFSRFALISILILTVSGTLSVLLFLPNLSYLGYTSWGKLLLVKVGAVVIVALVGFVIRLFLRKKKVNQSIAWVKLDLTLMVIILGLVGLITYMAPIPANGPLQWHQMGERVHVSVDIAPKVPGNNTFVAKVWLPEKSGKPKQVLLILHNKDDQDISPISVPLTLYTDNKEEESYGFAKFSYKAEGAYLPFRGKWELEMRVMDAEDNETVYTKEFIVY